MLLPRPGVVIIPKDWANGWGQADPFEVLEKEPFTGGSVSIVHKTLDAAEIVFSLHLCKRISQVVTRQAASFLDQSTTKYSCCRLGWKTTFSTSRIRVSTNLGKQASSIGRRKPSAFGTVTAHRFVSLLLRDLAYSLSIC